MPSRLDLGGALAGGGDGSGFLALSPDPAMGRVPMHAQDWWPS